MERNVNTKPHAQPDEQEALKRTYTVRIALVVLALLIIALCYVTRQAWNNAPSREAEKMQKAQEQLLQKIAEDQAKMAEEAKILIAEMERKKAEQEKIYRAYLSGAEMDQKQLTKIQERLKNLEYCEALISYECFTNSTASGAPVSSAPSHRYQLITTAYALDTSDTLPDNLSLDDDVLHPPVTDSTLGANRTNGDNRESPRTSPLVTRGENIQASAGSQRVTQADQRNQLHALQASSSGRQADSVTQERTERKIRAVLDLGYREAPVRALFTACKAQAKDPSHCLVVGLTLMHNEAGAGQKSIACTKRHNCLGVKSGKTSYKTYEDGMNAWVAIYNKYWYNAKGASFFYSPKGKLPPSRYCTSEHSSNSSVGCPNGLRIASERWEKVEKILKLKN